MNNFINIKKSTDPTINFWGLNPHLIYMRPYSILYNLDESKNKEDSSKTMYCIIWIIDPDEDTNKYYRLPEEERIEICKNLQPNFDKEEDLTKQIMERYPEDCMTIIERSLRDTKELIRRRDLFLKNSEYNFDTMVQIDNAIGKGVKLLEDFDKIEKRFIESKNTGMRIHGGRQQTPRERGRINPE